MCVCEREREGKLKEIESYKERDFNTNREEADIHREKNRDKY